MTQAVNLANFANNLDSSGGLNPLALNAATPISRGGTGATTAAGAATALAAAFGNLLYPVGSIYVNATNSTNPATLLGFGTWVSFGAGRVPVGFDSGNPLFNTAEATGGSANAAVISHTHTYSGTTSTQPKVGLGVGYSSAGGTYSPDISLGVQSLFATNNYIANSVTSVPAHNHTFSGTTDSTGSSGTNANYQPYITVYMWKRTA